MTINNLPDEILLGIFGFCMAYSLPPPPYEEDAWHTLVHVCRRWRYAIFGSPRRLNLRLLCMNGRLEKTLDIWPQLPIAIQVDGTGMFPLPSVTDVISALKQNDRVCKLFLDFVPNSFLQEVATISEPFPALIDLGISSSSYAEDAPTFPDSFLGGSVPRLRSLVLEGIPFPEIGKLLSSTRDLVTLTLEFVPDSGYISPEAMVAILSTLTRLKSFHLSYQIHSTYESEASRRPRAPVLTRIVLHALTTFHFTGNGKYLGDIVSLIDASLDCITIRVASCDRDQLTLDFPLLREFIWRTKLLDAPHRADISCIGYSSGISLFQRKGGVDFKVFSLEIPFYTSDSQLSALAQACSSLLLPLPTLEHLRIYTPESKLWSSERQTEEENAHWMELLRPFIAVKDLVLHKPAVMPVASALQSLVGERVKEILPALQIISLGISPSSGPVPEGIAKFVAARELNGRPVVVHHQETKQ